MSGNKHLFMGIDPGKNGAIVILDYLGGIFEAMTMPDEDKLKEISEWAHEMRNQLVVTLEDVQPDRGWHIKSAWTFAQHIGKLNLLFPRAIRANPRIWQSNMWATTGKTAKEKSLKTAQIYWPSMDWRGTPKSKKPHDGLVDAALIARFGMAAYLTHKKDNTKF